MVHVEGSLIFIFILIDLFHKPISFSFLSGYLRDHPLELYYYWLVESIFTSGVLNYKFLFQEHNINQHEVCVAAATPQEKSFPWGVSVSTLRLNINRPVIKSRCFNPESSMPPVRLLWHPVYIQPCHYVTSIPFWWA